MANRVLLSLHCFAYRRRACTSNLDVTGADINDDADEMEEEREDLEELSETIDSGEDIEETEFAKDDRLGKLYPVGDDVAHFSVH